MENNPQNILKIGKLFPFTNKHNSDNKFLIHIFINEEKMGKKKKKKIDN
jgi:hypothetical protein